MGKIQTEVVSMVQAGMKAGSSSRTSGTDAAFHKLLKEQNRKTDDQTKEAAVSGKDSPEKAPDAGKEDTKPVKESGQKGKPEDDLKNSVAVPSEALLQFQEQTGQLVTAIAETAADVLGQAGEIPETVPVSQQELLVSAEPKVQALPYQAEGLELQSAAENQTGPVMEAVKQEAGPEQAVSGQKEEGPAKVGERQTELLKPSEPSEPVEAQKAEKPEVSEKAFGSENGGNTEPGRQELVGMAEQSPREFTVREPEHVASEPVRTSEPTLVNDVGRVIAQRLPASDGTLTIELEPASLGKLTIHVLYESGKATVSIMATNPRTMELLNARAGELASIIEERTGQDTVVYTEQPEQEPPFDERQGERQHRDREQESREHRERTDQDSFMQQLRLGVI